MAYVEIETREGTRRVPIAGDRLSIGRLSYNDVVLANAQISRQHAEIRNINGEWWIADLHSTNGLHINSRRVQEHRLSPGDRLDLAPGIALVFHGDGVAAPPVAQQPPQMPQRREPPQATRPARFPDAYPPAPLGTPDVTPPGPAQYPAPNGWPVRTTSGGFTYPPVSPLGPRSPFADDEQPFFPQGFVAPSSASAPQAPIPADPFRMSGLRALGPVPTPPASVTQPSPFAPGATGISHHPPAVPNAPLGDSGPLRDPYRRSLPGASSSGDAGRATQGPAPTLLHLCQTCGQRTAPDAVYCQNCHRSIASECPRCRLSLLPVQDRCPRCQSPNPASVRRTHRGTSF